MPAPDFSIRLGLVGASQVITGVQSVLNMAGQLAGKIRELAEEADAYGDAVAGHTVSIEQARNATSGLVSAIDLHRAAARMEAAGINLTSTELRALAVAATDYAQRTGGEINESFQNLAESTIRASARGLRPLGIELERGGSLAENQRAIIDRLTAAYSTHTETVEGTADAIESLSNSWETFRNDLLVMLDATADPVADFLNTLRGGLDDILAGLRNTRELASTANREALQQRVADLEAERRGLGTFSGRAMARGRAALEAYDRGDMVTAVEAAVIEPGIGAITDALIGTQSPSIRRRYDEITRELGALNEQLRGSLQWRPGGEEFGTGALLFDASGMGGAPDDSGGRGGSNPRDALANSSIGQRGWDQFIQRVADADRELNERVAELYRGYGDQLDEFWTDLGNRWKEGQENLAEKRVEAEEECLRRLTEAQERYEERVIEQVRQEEEARQAAYERTVSYAQSISGVYNSLVSSIGDFAAAMAGSEEEQKKARGATYVAEQAGALLLAITLEAIYIAQNNIEGALAAGAAIITATVGLAKTSVEFGVSSKSGAGGSGKRHSPERTVGRMENGYQPTTIVHVNGVVTSAQVNEELMALQRDSSRGY